MSAPNLGALILREILQELDAGHVAVGVVEHELVDARGAEEMEGPSGASRWLRSECIAQALPKQVPSDLGITHHSISTDSRTP
jgi:hypothetical protein